MAARIQTDVKKWIEPDETGFILGRQGSDNISLNLQSIAARDEQSSELLSIDAEKASVGLKKVSSISALWWHPILVNYNKLIEQI